jgi:hypothetical protein
VERILAVADEPSLAAHQLEFQVFPGNFANPDDVNRAIRQGHLRLVEYHIGEADLVGNTLDLLPYASDEFALFLCTRDRMYFASSDQTLSTGDRLLCASLAQEESPLSSIFTRVRSLKPKQISKLADDPLAGSDSERASEPHGGA